MYAVAVVIHHVDFLGTRAVGNKRNLRSGIPLSPPTDCFDNPIGEPVSRQARTVSLSSCGRGAGRFHFTILRSSDPTIALQPKSGAIDANASEGNELGIHGRRGPVVDW